MPIERIDRFAGVFGESLMVRACPHPALRPHVLGYTGYSEHTTFTQRREAPTGAVTLIIDLGDGLRLSDPRRPAQVVEHRTGFVAGPTDHAALVDSGGRQTGLQINLSLVGARLLVGQPLRTITNQVVGLAELFGPDATRLADRLRATPSWPARFDMLDATLGARLEQADDIPPDLVHAWQVMADSRGRRPVASLAAELGCSRKHLTSRFSTHLGLPPKTVAGILRFRQVVTALGVGRRIDLSRLAADCGYYDQAHLNRDFRRFAGITPTEHLRLSTPDFGVRAH